MAKYLDPKADVTFKKVFGEHKNLVISLLNALLPLEDGKKVESIEYLPTELVPRTPIDKDTSVDVRCEETGGRKFIVEMQMNWRASFRQRVLFNASKAYVMQMPRGEEYKSLQPVYSLNLVNDTFEEDPDEYYHYYRLVHYMHTDRVLEGLHLVFVELPKFKAKNLTEKKMQVLWLRFLTEIGETTRDAPQELLDNPQVNQALGIVEESAYNAAEMYAYDRFWDYASREATKAAEWKRTEEALKEAEAGLKKAQARTKEAEARTKEAQACTKEAQARTKEAEARTKEAEARTKEAEARAEEAAGQLRQTARRLKTSGFSSKDISAFTGLPIADIDSL